MSCVELFTRLKLKQGLDGDINSSGWLAHASNGPADVPTGDENVHNSDEESIKRFEDDEELEGGFEASDNSDDVAGGFEVSEDEVEKADPADLNFDDFMDEMGI